MLQQKSTLRHEIDLCRQQKPHIGLPAGLPQPGLIRQGESDIGEHTFQETVPEDDRLRKVHDGRLHGGIQAAIEGHIDASPGPDFQHGLRQRNCRPEHIVL